MVERELSRRFEKTLRFRGRRRSEPGRGDGDEFDGGAATVGEDVVEEDDACGVPGYDSLRLSL